MLEEQTNICHPEFLGERMGQKCKTDIFSLSFLKSDLLAVMKKGQNSYFQQRSIIWFPEPITYSPFTHMQAAISQRQARVELRQQGKLTNHALPYIVTNTDGREQYLFN